VQEGEAQNLSGELLFDWLVDRALELPSHVITGRGADDEVRLRPEFTTLFEKFRIGKTRHVFGDAEAGETSTVRVVQCSDCHGDTDDSVGLQTAVTFLEKQRDLTSLTAQAERVLLRARRGGVEVGEGVFDLNQAIGTVVELEVMVHSFDADTSGAFDHKHREGIEHAEAALLAGQDGLRELSNRRRGLTIALGFILLLLVGLGLKIRWMVSPPGQEPTSRPS
jgi:hypothetical protein